MQQFTFEKQKIYSVSEYLDWVNSQIAVKTATIVGEVSKISEREKAVYFSIKDSEDNSMLNCLIWRFKYNMMGIKLAEGDKIKIQGAADIYKPMGSMSFKADVIELAGEGALKKAYDALKKKLESEGMFAADRKREIKKFPKNIALITSKYGDAIHDFNMNLTKAGFKIKFLDSRMEGAQAAPDIIGAIEYFNQAADFDAIVLTRGGGSWESLQAFNNEAVCRAVANSKIPILCGVGHEKDVPLACLVADKMVSTPTAAAEFLNISWKAAIFKADSIREKLLSRFSRELNNKKYALQKLQNGISGYFAGALADIRHKIQFAEQKLRDNNPQRLLDLGYSLILKNGKSVSSYRDLTVGDDIDIKMKDGIAGAEVKSMRSKKA